MRTIIAAATLALILSACSPMIWDKPGATQQDFTTDDYACKKDVRQSQFDNGMIARAIEVRAFYKECMAAHGWTMRES